MSGDQELKVSGNIDSIDPNEVFADVTFFVEGMRLHAQKELLAAKSQYFQDMFVESPNQKEFTISNTSLEAFKTFLKYIYTGVIPDAVLKPPEASDFGLFFKLFALARLHFFQSLVTKLLEKFSEICDITNVFFCINVANNEDLTEIRDICLSFIDENALDILSSESFEDLTQQSLTQILSRKSFVAPQIEIFKSVAKWTKANNNDVVLKSFELSSLTVSEILSTVWPTALVSAEALLETIDKKVNGSEHLPLTPVKTVNKNIADVQHGSTFMVVNLFSGTTDIHKTIKHNIGEESYIVIRLSKPHCVNHIRMRLYDADQRYYSYYIEASLDQSEWRRIVDYSKYACRSVQNLYFSEQLAQYIKIVGTRSSKENDFRVALFEIFYKTKIPKTLNGVIRPEKNVAISENKAVILKRDDCYPVPYGNFVNFAFHKIEENSSGFIIQLAQPYLISSMELLLDTRYQNTYNYFIHTSINKTDWELLADRRQIQGGHWDNVHFKERIVVFIKIAGTYCLNEPKIFFCDHFECSGKNKKY